MSSVIPSIDSRHFSADTVGTVVTHGSAKLLSVNVNTGDADATVTLYNGTSTAGEVIAEIDAATKSNPFYGRFCPNGTFIVITEDPDVTVSFI